MTAELLNEIVKMADMRKIERELRRLGYVDVTKHSQLNRLSLVSWENGDKINSDDFFDLKYTLYDGIITTNVEGAKEWEFVSVNAYFLLNMETNEWKQKDILIFTKRLGEVQC